MWCRSTIVSATLTLIIFALICFQLVESNVSGSVINLTASSVQEFLDSKDDVVLMVYANWCHHCTVTKPKFIAAARKSKGAKFGFLDGDTAKKFIRDKNIKGYPFIMGVSRNGTEFKYSGNRTVESIVEFSNFK